MSLTRTFDGEDFELIGGDIDNRIPDALETEEENTALSESAHETSVTSGPTETDHQTPVDIRASAMNIPTRAAFTRAEKGKEPAPENDHEASRSKTPAMNIPRVTISDENASTTFNSSADIISMLNRQLSHSPGGVTLVENKKEHTITLRFPDTFEGLTSTSSTSTNPTTSTIPTTQSNNDWAKICEKFGVEPTPEMILNLDDFEDLLFEMPPQLEVEESNQNNVPEDDFLILLPANLDEIAATDPAAAVEVVRQTWGEWLKSKSPEFINEIAHHPIASALALLTTGQPLISAFMNVSGKAPSEIVKAWNEMTPGQRALSIVNGASSFQVNYPFNFNILLEAALKVKKNVKGAIEDPKSFVDALLSFGLAANAALANGALAYEAFIFLSGIWGGSIPIGIAGFAALSNFTSRWTAVLRAMNIIKNLISHDARLQLNTVDMLINQLNLDYQTSTGTRLGDELEEALQTTITSLLQKKRTYSQKDLIAILREEERVLLQLIKEHLKEVDDKLPPITANTLKEFLELTPPSELTSANEQSPLNPVDFSSVTQIQEQLKVYRVFEKDLLELDAPIAQKLEYQKDLFQVLTFLKPTSKVPDITAHVSDDNDDENASQSQVVSEPDSSYKGFYVIPSTATTKQIDEEKQINNEINDFNLVSAPNLIEVIHAAGLRKFEEITRKKHANRDLKLEDSKDYEKLFTAILNTIVNTIDQKSRATEASINGPSSTEASSESNPLFHPKSPTSTAGEGLTILSRIISALIFGIVGGGVYMQKGFDGVDIIHQLLEGKPFTQEQLDDLERAGIGLPAGFASALLYGISAADFPRLFFSVLPAAVKSSKMSYAKLASFIVFNFFASASMASVTENVLNKDSVITWVEKLLSLGIFNEEQTKLFAPYIARLGGAMVNMVPILRVFDTDKPIDPNKPTLQNVLKHFGDVNSHPLKDKGLAALHVARAKFNHFQSAKPVAPPAAEQPDLRSSNANNIHSV